MKQSIAISEAENFILFIKPEFNKDNSTCELGCPNLLCNDCTLFLEKQVEANKDISRDGAGKRRVETNACT